MKFFKRSISLVIISFTLITHPSHSQTNGKGGEIVGLKIHKQATKIPQFEFIDQAGKRISNNNLIGNISVINIWATWCSPCVKELPSLDRLSKAVSGDNIRIYAVSQDRAGNKVVPPFFQKLNLKNLPIYLDNQGILMSAFRTPVLPTTIIVDKNGTEVARLVGGIEWTRLK